MAKKDVGVGSEMDISLDVSSAGPHETFVILSANGDTVKQDSSAVSTSNLHLDGSSIATSSHEFVKIDHVERGDSNSDGTVIDDREGAQCIDNTIVVSRTIPSDANIYGRLYLGENGSQVIFYNTAPTDCTAEQVCTENEKSDSTEIQEENNFVSGQEKKPSSSNPKNYTRNSSGERTFVCPVEDCGRHFTSSGHLKYHQSTHNGEKPFKCPHPGCDRVFAWPAHLKYHIKTHSGDRPYKCEVEGCGKSFYVLQRLNVHLRVHTGERPYMCEVEDCKKSFSTAGNLKNHMRIHTGERPYVCPFVTCGRSFTEHSSLRKHKLRHTGEKPYACEICGKSFSQSGSRNAHEKRHLLERPPRYKKSQLTMVEKETIVESEQEEPSPVDTGEEASLEYTPEKTNDHIVLAQPIIAKEVSIETTPVSSLTSVAQNVAEELIANQQTVVPQTSTCVVSLAETVVAQQALLQSMLDGTAVIPVSQAESSDDLTVVDHVLQHQDVEQIMQSVVSQHIINGQIQLPIGGDVTVTSEQGTLSFIAQSGNSQNIVINHSEQEENSLHSDEEETVIELSETSEDS